MSPIRILLADDHVVMRNGLRLLLESDPLLRVVAEAGDGADAVAQARAVSPDVVVLDIAMPHVSGIDAAQQIHTALPQTGLVMLSMHSDESYVRQALKAGAKAYLLKDSAADDLIEAIKAVHQGRVYLSAEVSGALVTG